MDVTKTPLPNKLDATFRAQVTAHIARNSRVCIALSGGVDSVVLLHLFAQLRTDYPMTLSAIHVHHGISVHADHWAQTCQQLCDQLAIPLQTCNINLHHRAELGLEAAARSARYAAFQQQHADFIALAHHRDDQVETLMLQLLRGAGAKGLAGMPVLRQPANQPAYIRPLLDIDRSCILDWANQHGLHWIDDESNLDTHYARNFLRHEILPRLNQRYPAWRATLARSAQNLGEAALLLDELAQLDAIDGIKEQGISCHYLNQLSPPRARNLLRYFLSMHGVTMPSQIALTEMLEQLTQADADRNMAIHHDGHTLHRFQHYGYLVKQFAAPAPDSRWHWQGEPQLALPALGGTLHFSYQPAPGLDLNKLHNINIRLRLGGEMFRPDIKRPNHRLKSLLQEADIPPWQRDRIPLIYSDDTLIHVPGIGTAHDWQALPASQSLHIGWITGSPDKLTHK